jgi:TM2 domain-containing membrane protein YozV
MSLLSPLLSLPKRRYWAIALAIVSAVLPWPIAGLHKFYLGQPIWGGVYWLLWNTPIPRIACAIDAVWYFVQGEADFNRQFNSGERGSWIGPGGNLHPSRQVIGMAEAMRELEQLRGEGLLSEYEFEQKRRQLLE